MLPFSEGSGHRMCMACRLGGSEPITPTVCCNGVEECRALLREAMCGGLALDPPLEVELGVGDDWVSAKE